MFLNSVSLDLMVLPYQWLQVKGEIVIIFNLVGVDSH